MLLKTPKDNSIVCVLVGIQFFLIPINNYIWHYVQIEYSDLQIAGDSAVPTLIISFVLLFFSSHLFTGR